MNKKIVNLTLPLVTEAVEDILVTYPKYPYQELFTPSGLRQELIAYVLSRIPNTFTVVEEKHSFSANPTQLLLDSKQQLQIENLIHIGIRDVLHLYSRKHYYIPSLDGSVSMTSN
jgi:hypothetical protein